MRNPATETPERPEAHPTPDARTYAPPAVEWEEAIEIRVNLALGCNKLGGTSGFCNQAPSS